MISQINLWEMGSDINVNVHTEFLSLLNKKIKQKFKNKPRFYEKLKGEYSIPFSTFKNLLKESYSYSIPLDLLIYTCKFVGISLETMQKNVISYKIKKGINTISQPRLPVIITPLLSMLVAHFIGDGYVVQSEGRKSYFGYRQYDSFYRDLFIKKIESVFGEITHSSGYILKTNTTQVYFPIVCSEMIFKLYGMNKNSFKTEIARIPEEIMKGSEDDKISFLIGIIIDEGHIDSNLIAIGMKNKGFIQDLRKLCESLGYSNTSLNEGKEGMIRFYILSKSVKKFYGDYQRLLRKYSEVDLGVKGEKIKRFIDRLDKPKVYIKGNKERILELLKRENLSINEIANQMDMTRQGARYLTKKLVEEQKVEIKRVSKFKTYKYGIK